MSFLLLLDPNLYTHSHHGLCRTRVEYGMIKSGVSDPDLDPNEAATIYSLGSGPEYAFQIQFRVRIQKNQTKADPCGSRKAETMFIHSRSDSYTTHDKVGIHGDCV